MAETVDGGRSRTGRLDQRVIVICIRELPLLHLVHRGPADLHRALLAKYGDRAFEVLRVRQHRDFNRAKCAAAKFEHGDARVFGFDPAGHRRRFGNNAFHRTAEPLH